MGHMDLPLSLLGTHQSDESADDSSLVLPGGLLNREGQVCRRVHVRALNGADEEALFERGVSGSARVSAFLARAIAGIDGIDEPMDEALMSEMLLGDRDYLLLRLRQIELGDAVHAFAAEQARGEVGA